MRTYTGNIRFPIDSDRDKDAALMDSCGVRRYRWCKKDRRFEHVFLDDDALDELKKRAPQATFTFKENKAKPYGTEPIEPTS
jgi:hypothetical protein